MSDRRLAIGPRVLDVGELAALVAGDEPGAYGAVVTFVGTVRNLNQGRRVIRLEYEAYEPMALREMAKIGRPACRYSKTLLDIDSGRRPLTSSRPSAARW